MFMRAGMISMMGRIELIWLGEGLGSPEKAVSWPQSTINQRDKVK